MKSTATKEMNPARRVVALVTLFALMSPLILSARSGQVSALAHGADASDTGTTPLTTEQAQEAYGKIDMSFEENRGQTADEVKFLAHGGGYTLFLAGTEAVFVLARQSDAQTETPRREQFLRGDAASSAPDVEPSEPPAILRMKLEGANPRPAVSGLNELEGKVNYFIGNDPQKWHTEIPTFGRVRYEEVYQGVGMVYYGNQRQLEYDFVVAPGADYKQIALKFEGADGVELEAGTGDLLLRVGDQTMRQQRPVVYQEVNGERQEIESGYALKGAGRVEFAVGEYDSSKPLIIDPVLAYSTYLGGSGQDRGSGIVVDGAGNAYVTGFTVSSNFPTTGAIQGVNGGGEDAFVTKLNAAGSALVYSTYLGGSGQDEGLGIAVDSAGNAYVAGVTGSTNFPTTGAIQGANGGGAFDAFVTKLNAAGSALVYSTYLGGSDIDQGVDIAVDAAGNAYVTGFTASTNFPTTGAIQGTPGGGTFDAFVTKLNAAGSALVYSTYLGGNGEDQGYGIVVDATGNAYVSGFTPSTNFPTMGAIQGANGGHADAFVTKLNAAGNALVYSTYLGGSENELGFGIALDSAGNAYVSGFTSSTNFPTANAYQGTLGGGSSTDAFVTKLNAAGNALVYSTYLGGSNDDFGAGIAVDSSGNAYVSGFTLSTNFPTANAYQGTYGGGQDAFVTKLNAAGSAPLVYSTYLGGSDRDAGLGIAVDAAGNAYVTGDTSSTNFPTTASAFQPTHSGVQDAFIAKLGNFVISGRVIDSSGNGISGVTVTLSGSNSDITATGANGNFLFHNTTPGGNFTVTPTTTGFTFSPQSITVNELNGNQSLIFVGTVTGPTPTPTPTPGAAHVQFEFDTYITPEDCSSIDVAVIRTGDTSGALTVDFATADATAKQKSDYTITIGTLSFAPGETRKTITLLISEDAFNEGDENFSVNLFNLIGAATLDQASRATIIIADDDPSGTTTNPIDDTQIFVSQHYHDFLNRPPDTSGLLFWMNNIESCGANATCREAKRIDTSAAFFFSIEFQATGFHAIRLQRAAFGKRSDTATMRMTYQDLVRDTRQLGDGVIVGQAGADAKLEQNKQAYATQVVNSAVFISRFPTSLTAAQYVDALFASAQVTPTTTERNDAITAFGGGGTAGRVAALRKVSDSPSLSNAEFSPAFVLLQFHGYLRRNPTDLPDTNDSGYQFWLNKLNAFGGDFRKADMVKAFITSAEYRQRFGQF